MVFADEMMRSMGKRARGGGSPSLQSLLQPQDLKTSDLVLGWL